MSSTRSLCRALCVASSSAFALSTTLSCKVYDADYGRTGRAQGAQSGAGVGASCSRDSDCKNVEPAALCARQSQRCVPVLTQDCTQYLGPYQTADAIRIGSLFSTSGPRGEINHAREQAASMAIEELNAAGGVPTPSAANKHPLLLVSCDTSNDLQRAAEHLVHDLGVAAIIGPNRSQDTIDLTTQLTFSTGTLTISPTAVAASIADLVDDDLSWTMVPTDAQRAPLLLQQIDGLAERLQRERERDSLKLGVVLRDDVLGAGTRVALDALRFNGQPLSDPRNLGEQVRIVDFDPNASEQSALVDELIAFAPDIVLLVGTPDSVTEIMAPLEARWAGTSATRELPPPYYLLTESSKVPDLLRLGSDHADLRARVRGIGVTPTTTAVPVFEAFRSSYQRRFGSDPSDVSGASVSYDAVYTIAYALAASGDEPASGASIAAGLRQLNMGEAWAATGANDIATAFHALMATHTIDGIGTLGPLAWNSSGTPKHGMIEVWCLGSVAEHADQVSFQSSGVTFDVDTQNVSGMDVGCDRQAQPDSSRTARDKPQDANRRPGQAAGSDADGGMGDVPTTGARALDIGLVAQYRANDRDPHNGSILPFLRVVDRGSNAVGLSELRVRYYFTNEHAELCPSGCVVDGYYAGLQPSGRDVDVTRSYVTDGGVTYLEIAFPDGSPELQPGTYVELQQQIHTEPYQNLDETDDYSYDTSSNDFVDWPRVTIYQGAQLVWGTPPP